MGRRYDPRREVTDVIPVEARELQMIARIAKKLKLQRIQQKREESNSSRNFWKTKCRWMSTKILWSLPTVSIGIIISSSVTCNMHSVYFICTNSATSNVHTVYLICTKNATCNVPPVYFICTNPSVQL